MMNEPNLHILYQWILLYLHVLHKIMANDISMPFADIYSTLNNILHTYLIKKKTYYQV